METFFNPKIEESIKELAFQLFKEEILYKHKYEIETIFDKIKTQVENLKNKKKEPISFRNAELIELIRKICEIDPYAVSIVDTYGFMQKQDILRLFYLFDLIGYALFFLAPNSGVIKFCL